MPLLGDAPYDLLGPPPDVNPYYSDPSSIGYVPYCDASALYYDPSSCEEMVEPESSFPDGPGASEVAHPSADGMVATTQGQPLAPYAGRSDLFGPIVPSGGDPGRAAGTSDAPGSSLSAIPYGPGGSRGYTGQ